MDTNAHYPWPPWSVCPGRWLHVVQPGGDDSSLPPPGDMPLCLWTWQNPAGPWCLLAAREASLVGSGNLPPLGTVTSSFLWVSCLIWIKGPIRYCDSRIYVLFWFPHVTRSTRTDPWAAHVTLLHSYCNTCLIHSPEPNNFTSTSVCSSALIMTLHFLLWDIVCLRLMIICTFPASTELISSSL